MRTVGTGFPARFQPVTYVRPHNLLRGRCSYIKSAFKYKNRGPFVTRKSADEAVTLAPALEKGLDVLELLAAEPHGLNLQDIARRLDRSPNELFRMVDVLVRRGFLARRPDLH